MFVGYVINNAVGLYALFFEGDEDIVIDGMNFLLTIPAWPYTLYKIIQNVLPGK